jgi:CheY-like chemotaxis protein
MHKIGAALIFVINRRMNKSGPIVLIDDDEDDLKLLIDIFGDLNLPNEIHLFKNTSTALAFLQQDDIDPFLIISDINMPIMNGFQFRELILNDQALNKKKIPFLFFTTSFNFQVVSKTNNLSVQGVFLKPSKTAEWHHTLKTIVTYWQLSVSPETYEL